MSALKPNTLVDNFPCWLTVSPKDPLENLWAVADKLNFSSAFSECGVFKGFYYWCDITFLFQTNLANCSIRTSFIVHLTLRRLSRNFPVTSVTRKFRGSWRLVTGKSRTRIMKRGRHGEVSGFQTCRYGLKKSRDKSATSPFASFGNKHDDTTNGLSHVAAHQAVRRPITH